MLGGSTPAASEGVALAVMGGDSDSFVVAVPRFVEESADPLRDDCPRVSMRCGAPEGEEFSFTWFWC